MHILNYNAPNLIIDNNNNSKNSTKLLEQEHKYDFWCLLAYTGLTE